VETEKIALFDMDGTLCDYEGALKRDLAKLAAPGDHEFEPFGDHPHYIEERIRLIRQRPGWWRELDFLPLGRKIMDVFSHFNFNRHILTKGPHNNPMAWAEKVEWCELHLRNHYKFNITITEDKGLVYGTVLVDDYPKYVKRWLEWRPRGLVVMPAHPYNADFSHPNVLRFDGTEEKRIELFDRLKDAHDR